MTKTIFSFLIFRLCNTNTDVIRVDMQGGSISEQNPAKNYAAGTQYEKIFVSLLNCWSSSAFVCIKLVNIILLYSLYECIG